MHAVLNPRSCNKESTPHSSSTPPPLNILTSSGLTAFLASLTSSFSVQVRTRYAVKESHPVSRKWSRVGPIPGDHSIPRWYRESIPRFPDTQFSGLYNSSGKRVLVLQRKGIISIRFGAGVCILLMVQVLPRRLLLAIFSLVNDSFIVQGKRPAEL